MPVTELESHPATAGPVPASTPNGAEPTNNHNPATVEQSSLYSDLLSLDHESGSQYPSNKRLRDRFKSAFGPRNRPSEKTLSVYSKTFDQKIRSIDSYEGGYPKVAAMEDSDPNFLMCRKFGWLHLRVLLHHQDELVELEEELERLDAFDAGSDFRKLKSRRRDEAIDSKRKGLLNKIDTSLAAYDELLLRFQNIDSLKRPTQRNQASMCNFLHNTRSLAESEAEWVRRGDDLAALGADREHSWFGGFAEDIMFKISRTATKFLFRTKEQRLKAGNEHVTLLSLSRFDAFVSALITILATALLLIPVAILYVSRLNVILQTLIIFAFTMIFAGCCAIFTKARRHEVFGAVAAYCAVLVVVLGNSMSKGASCT